MQWLKGPELRSRLYAKKYFFNDRKVILSYEKRTLPLGEQKRKGVFSQSEMQSPAKASLFLRDIKKVYTIAIARSCLCLPCRFSAA
jgi:hypothetical protein